MAPTARKRSKDATTAHCEKKPFRIVLNVIQKSSFIPLAPRISSVQSVGGESGEDDQGRRRYLSGAVERHSAVTDLQTRQMYGCTELV